MRELVDVEQTNYPELDKDAIEGVLRGMEANDTRMWSRRLEHALKDRTAQGSNIWIAGTIPTKDGTVFALINDEDHPMKVETDLKAGDFYLRDVKLTMFGGGISFVKLTVKRSLKYQGNSFATCMTIVDGGSKE